VTHLPFAVIAPVFAPEAGDDGVERTLEVHDAVVLVEPGRPEGLVKARDAGHSATLEPPDPIFYRVTMGAPDAPDDLSPRTLEHEGGVPRGLRTRECVGGVRAAATAAAAAPGVTLADQQSDHEDGEERAEQCGSHGVLSCGVSLKLINSLLYMPPIVFLSVF